MATISNSVEEVEVDVAILKQIQSFHEQAATELGERIFNHKITGKIEHEHTDNRPELNLEELERIANEQLVELTASHPEQRGNFTVQLWSPLPSSGAYRYKPLDPRTSGSGMSAS